MEARERETNVLAFLKTKHDLVKKIVKESKNRIELGNKLFMLVLDYRDICVFTTPRCKELDKLVQRSVTQYVNLANWNQIAYNIEREFKVRY